jgi:hypothetical protein
MPIVPASHAPNFCVEVFRAIKAIRANKAIGEKRLRADGRLSRFSASKADSMI